MKRCIVLLGPLLLLAACLPDTLPVGDIPQLKPKIVVSSQLDGNQTVFILLTKSVGALEASDDSDAQELLNRIAINDAEVIIRTPEFSETLQFIGNGAYVSLDIPLIEGVEYSLEVNSPSMGRVTATTYVKPMVPFEFIDPSIYSNGFDTLVEVSYGFEDPLDKNYYMFNVQRITEEVEPEDLLNPEIFTQLIDDHTFDGKAYIDRKRVYADRDFMPGDTIGFFLSNISKEYYDFMQVRIDSRLSFADFVGEPANYPTNIRGGLGFFNLYLPDVRILEVQ